MTNPNASPNTARSSPSLLSVAQTASDDTTRSALLGLAENYGRLANAVATGRLANETEQGRKLDAAPGLCRGPRPHAYLPTSALIVLVLFGEPRPPTRS